MHIVQGPLSVGAIQSVPVRSLNNASGDKLQEQYMLFLKRLEELTKPYSLEEPCVTAPGDILKHFFNPQPPLFTEIEIM